MLPLCVPFYSVLSSTEIVFFFMILQNKVAIVTGGSRGIGRAIVIKLASMGADVIFTYVNNQQAAEEVTKQALLYGNKVIAIKNDAGDINCGEILVNETLSQLGKIDICVNNAGITKDNLLMRVSNENWQQVINTNLSSVFSVCKHVVRPMMKSGGGSIINMSSIIGIRGNAGQTAYAATKAGLIGFTKSMALELGSRNIRCNCIAPGFIETDMTASLHQHTAAEDFLKKIPLGRFGKSEEIADTVAFLCSPNSAYITGQVISVCGGMSI